MLVTQMSDGRELVTEVAAPPSFAALKLFNQAVMPSAAHALHAPLLLESMSAAALQEVRMTAVCAVSHRAREWRASTTACVHYRKSTSDDRLRLEVVRGARALR